VRLGRVGCLASDVPATGRPRSYGIRPTDTNACGSVTASVTASSPRRAQTARRTAKERSNNHELPVSALTGPAPVRPTRASAARRPTSRHRPEPAAGQVAKVTREARSDVPCHGAAGGRWGRGEHGHRARPGADRAGHGRRPMGRARLAYQRQGARPGAARPVALGRSAVRPLEAALRSGELTARGPTGHCGLPGRRLSRRDLHAGMTLHLRHRFDQRVRDAPLFAFAQVPDPAVRRR
jgi:hypothetical protein